MNLDVLGVRPLSDARVLVVGAGGLGHPAALALAASGVGGIGIADADRVELSNLPRQFLFSAADLGAGKADALARRLRRLHPSIATEAHNFHLDTSSAQGLIGEYDFVVDATDRAESKFLVHDAAVAALRPMSHAGVVGDRAQMLTVIPGQSCCLRCLFPTPPDAADVPTCEQAGVLGPLVGIVGTLQAAEAVKFLTGVGRLATDRVLTFERGRWRAVSVRREPDCRLCALL